MFDNSLFSRASERAAGDISSATNDIANQPSTSPASRNDSELVNVKGRAKQHWLKGHEGGQDAGARIVRRDYDTRQVHSLLSIPYNPRQNSAEHGEVWSLPGEFEPATTCPCQSPRSGRPPR
ncbi:hypothetical protein HGRIS_004651 [Hohenbuehelia grisea]|uniref:Uncharacterized protein n=1 Tax=Hohenbuehelia grisea TaxID=104357 RepID=A0ABR3JCK8_9AGAR